MCGLGAAYSNDYACGKATVLYFGPCVRSSSVEASVQGSSRTSLGPSGCVFWDHSVLFLAAIGLERRKASR